MHARWSKALRTAYLVLLFGFLYIPIAVLIVFSFNESKSRSVFTGFTLSWYRNLFHDEMILSALGTSVLIAVVSSVLVTVLGTAAAIGINSMRKGPRGMVTTVSHIPNVDPEIITGISLMLLFVGIKNLFGINLFGLPTLIIAHITFNLPIVIFSVLPKLRQMDIRLYEAALDLGCNPRQAFFKVVLPEIMPGIISGLLMSFTYSMDDFVISYFSAGTVQTLPIAIYSMTRKKVSPEINALSTVLFIIILSVVLISDFAAKQQEKKEPKTVQPV